MSAKKVTLHMEIKTWMTDDKDDSRMSEVNVDAKHYSVPQTAVPKLQKILTDGAHRTVSEMNDFGQQFADAKAAADSPVVQSK